MIRLTNYHNRIVTAALCLLVLLSTGVGQKGQLQRRIQVSGRAVDRHGVPLSGVRATLFSPPCPGCIDNVVPNRSFSDGAFFVDSAGTLRDRFTLYLEEIVPVGFWSPLGGPPYYELAHLPEFRGIRIRLRRQSSYIDLGNVEVKIRFGKVILKVPENWKQLAPESTSLVLRLRDRSGAVIYDGKLAVTTASARSESLKLALTPGRWKVQLVLHHNNQEFSSPIKSLIVRSASCLFLPLTKVARAEPCGG